MQDDNARTAARAAARQLGPTHDMDLIVVTGNGRLEQSQTEEHQNAREEGESACPAKDGGSDWTTHACTKSTEEHTEGSCEDAIPWIFGSLHL
jgi:hypothetical protein